MKDFIYKVNNKEYNVRIIHKRIKRTYFRFINNEFVISCHPLTSNFSIIKGLDKFAVGLINKARKEEPIGEEYIYLYGNKVSIHNFGEIKFTNDETIKYTSKEELLKKLKKQYLAVITNKVKYFSSLMNVPLYKVSVRNMSTRYGSNSRKTKSVHFSTILMHYSGEIIDSVVVHELAHILVYNHSKQFYDVVYKYCPNYKVCRKKLIRGEYR
ncbi:MAG: M48 family metallopeptidase [Bacilli bacterium]|nr:M48 family metallopeptidase [Bacilli bacterium]